MHPLLGTQPATQACALTGNLTGDPLGRRLAFNPWSHTSLGILSIFLMSKCTSQNKGFHSTCYVSILVDFINILSFVILNEVLSSILLCVYVYIICAYIILLILNTCYLTESSLLVNSQIFSFQLQFTFNIIQYQFQMYDMKFRQSCTLQSGTLVFQVPICPHTQL